MVERWRRVERRGGYLLALRAKVWMSSDVRAVVLCGVDRAGVTRGWRENKPLAGRPKQRHNKISGILSHEDPLLLTCF